MKLSLKIVWKTKVTFWLSETFLFFFKQKYIFYSWRQIFFKIPKNLIASAFFLPRQILKHIDMPRQKPWDLPAAKANFECWGSKYTSEYNEQKPVQSQQ